MRYVVMTMKGDVDEGFDSVCADDVFYTSLIEWVWA